MALADSVRVYAAFLLGFYDQFIDSIDDLVSRVREKKKYRAFFFFY